MAKAPSALRGRWGWHRAGADAEEGNCGWTSLFPRPREEILPRHPSREGRVSNKIWIIRDHSESDPYFYIRKGPENQGAQTQPKQRLLSLGQRESAEARSPQEGE